MEHRLPAIFAGLAIGALINVVYALWSGRFPIGSVLRAQDPRRFWTWTAGAAALGVVSAIVSALMFASHG